MPQEEKKKALSSPLTPFAQRVCSAGLSRISELFVPRLWRDVQGGEEMRSISLCSLLLLKWNWKRTYRVASTVTRDHHLLSQKAILVSKRGIADWLVFFFFSSWRGKNRLKKKWNLKEFLKMPLHSFQCSRAGLLMVSARQIFSPFVYLIFSQHSCTASMPLKQHPLLFI